MVSFIDEHRDEYGVEPICEMLPIAPSTLFVHMARRANPELLSARAKRRRAAARGSPNLGRQSPGVWGTQGLEAVS